MNTKPEWNTLPRVMQEELLWDMELDYDGYESSKVEEINSILAEDGYISSINEAIIKNYYKALSLPDLIVKVQHVRDRLVRELAGVTDLLNRG